MKEDLIRKIKALAEKGIGGEKANAQKLLKQLMVKYNIKEEDIDEEEIKEFDISFPKYFNGQKLMIQVFYSIVEHSDDNKDKGFFEGKIGGRRKRVFVRCTSEEFLEFKAKFKFYEYHFKKELETFYIAFIQANSIFPASGGTIDRELTEEEKAAVLLSKSLKKHDYLLQIED